MNQLKISLIICYLINNAFTSLIINMKSDYSGAINFYVDSSVSKSSISVKVNNRVTSLVYLSETINNNKNLKSYKFQNEPGDIEIIINSRQLYICYMFQLNTFLYSITMKSSETYVTNMEYIFNQCFKLTSVDLTQLDLSKVTSFLASFQDCKYLVSIKFGNYTTQNLNLMGQMFYNCKRLKSVDLSNFDTSKVTDMSSIFYSCSQLVEIKLDNFNTSSVTSMGGMFCGCTVLSSLNISSFKTTNVIYMDQMFSECFSLTSLDLSNFETTVTEYMESMFEGCESLIYLNINNFDTSKVITMENMFRNCRSLTSLNLSNFQVSESINLNQMFLGIAENLIYCMNDEFYEKIKSEMNQKKCALRVINCFPDWTNTSKKIINENGQCVENCNLTKDYKYEFQSKCYSSCPKGTTSLYNNDYICEIFDEITFIDNQKQKEIIKIDSTYESTYINTINTINTIINSEEIITNMAIETTNIRKWKISDIICQPYYFFNNECLPTIHNSMIEMIINDIVNGQIDQLLENVINENKIDIYKYDNNIKYQITSSFNQKNKAYENISIIDLKDCEDQLKYIYNISLNDTLIIFKYDYILKEISTPIVGYEIFHPKTKKILDLNHCKDKKIDIFTPVNIDENKLYKHDPNNNYYKDK